VPGTGLLAWITAAGITSEPVFRALDRQAVLKW
jgi:hypothetical protein